MQKRPVPDHEHLRKTENKYTAALPWKDNHDILPTNHDICYKRTRNMVKRLEPHSLKAYDSIIQEQRVRQYIERVETDDASYGHYIPHHAVHKQSPTTPIRIVYDCSFKQRNNPSLNDCLDAGPLMINNMIDILLRFRLHKIALVSDIEKAFLNIRLSEKDRDYTKIFWLSNQDYPNSEFDVLKFKSILFGSVSSPFILNAVIKTDLETILAEPLRHY